ncbi:MAG: MATE family efflux transporter, partial [Oscillospiraceae bacterium]|nr:MATE family efflux transporter [Oscillospiraceae bacterium]
MEQNRILEGGLYKNIMLFFLPIWFGTFFQQLYNTVDAVIVGNFVGKAALAAVGGPTGTIINLLVNFFVGISSGAGVVIAMYYGSRNVEKTYRSIHTAVAISIAGGLILMAIGIPFSPLFLEWMGTPADILEQATVYIRIYFCGAVFNLVYNIGSGILRAMGDSKKPLYFLIVASIVNIVLDVIFVVGFKMGVAGVGLATIIAQFSSAVLVIITLKKLPEDIMLDFKQVRLNKAMCGEIFKIGIPNGIQSIAFSISNIAIMSSINAFGTDTVAAWTAYGKIDAMFWMTVGSFGIATTTFVGQNF